MAALAAAEITHQNSSCLTDPGHLHRPAALQDHGHFIVNPADFPDQPVLVRRQLQILPVKSFRFIVFRKPGEYQDRIPALTGSAGLFQKLFFIRPCLQAVTAGISHLTACLLQRCQGIVPLHRIYLAAARPLISGKLGQSTDHRDLLA